MRLELRMRKLRLVNTDPQRRCYNGCHFSYDLIWTPWEVLDSNVKPEKVESTLVFWRELNDYAVSQRGESAKAEYEIVEIEE